MPVNTGYTCDYYFKVPSLTYRNTAYIEVYLEVLTNAVPRLHTGNDRSNLTSTTLDDDPAYVGAPVTALVDDGIILISYVNTLGGSVQLSYKVVGEAYPWWE